MHSSAARGFALLWLLAFVAVLGLVAAHSAALGHDASRRDAERALLDIGEEFRAALASWRLATPGQPAAGPTELKDLLRDPRTPGVRRHLRRLHADPLTGRDTWGLVRDDAGRIVAVYSLAPGVPIKRSGFGPQQAGFEEADTYARWRFGFAPAVPPTPGRANRP
jgi:hypothetical protein